jgi:pimeloyl-ACP methyl ester carboxylesterase
MRCWDGYLMNSKIDVGGYEIEYEMLGEGKPTVVLIQGAGHTMQEHWHLVLPQIGEFTRVIAYNRANLGASDKVETSRTWRDWADELARLLLALGENAPVILVAGSVGGIAARMFQHLYRDQVCGIVFVDSSHEEQGQRFQKCLTPPSKEDSDLLKNMRRWYVTQTGGEPTVHIEDVEHVDWRKSLLQTQQLGVMGDLPLIVLTAEHSPIPSFVSGLPESVRKAMRVEWLEMQKKLFGLSTNSRHEIVMGSQHMIALTRDGQVKTLFRPKAEKSGTSQSTCSVFLIKGESQREISRKGVGSGDGAGARNGD